MTNLFLNRLLFVIEIWIGELIYCHCLPKQKHFALRLSVGIVLTLGLAAVMDFPIDNAFSSSGLFLLLFLSVFLAVKFCFSESWIKITFCSIDAYTTQHFSYEFTNLILTLITNGTSPLLGTYGSDLIDFSNWDWLFFYSAVYVLCYYVCYWAAYALFARRIRNDSDLDIKSSWLLLLVGVGLLVDVALNSFFVYNKISNNTSADAINVSLMIYTYNCLCCILLLVVQFGLVLRRHLETELDTIKRLWHVRAEQYKISKENIDIINQKCHDMKHQIRQIGLTKQVPKDVVDEIEKSVSVYDATVKTGNEVLDTILTEKSLRCAANKIILTCVADGPKIAFMSESDIYSLFGNALDNAIEACLKIPEKEKRVIDLVLYEKKGFVALTIDNAFSGVIELKDGLPKTTKGDLNYHGFGMKSMKMIVEKYGGEIDVSTSDHVFSVNILIPLGMAGENPCQKPNDSE
jgi:hypothetical protein